MVDINLKKLERMLDDRYRSIRILKEIKKGERSTTKIAVKTGSTPQLVIWYIKTLELKDGEQ